VICGGLCLLSGLALVLLGSLSSRFILNEQQQLHGEAIARQVAQQIAPILARGDLIRLEVSLRQLQSSHQLLEVEVLDVEGRALAATGAVPRGTGMRFRSPITLGGNLAGESLIVVAAESGLAELRRMSLVLFSLSLLLSIFTTILAAKWGQHLAQRLNAATAQLDHIDTANDAKKSGDELTQLENAISRLPLNLLKPSASASASTDNYHHANVLYIRLTSLVAHVETLDETSLIHATELQRRLITGAAELYDGSVSVVRQFGLLVSFGEGHNTGDPAVRALSTAWLVKQVSATLNNELPLRMKFSMACGFTEVGTGSSEDVYPDLYNQHLIDELEAATNGDSESILLMNAVATDVQVNLCCSLSRDENHSSLDGFSEPYHDLLERQQQLLLANLRSI
jgi:hypothetical protein